MNTLRPDLRALAALVPHEAHVLDVGCGDGALLAWLMQHKAVEGRGMDIDAGNVTAAIAAGVPVIQGDIETDLSFYPDGSFDIAVLSQTLQAAKQPHLLLKELLRVARKAIVSVPNFGYWKNRAHLAIRGRMPVTKTLSYAWYETPNIHFCTLKDFVQLCDEMGIIIERRLWVNAHGEPVRFYGKGICANLLAEQGIFVIHRK